MPFVCATFVLICANFFYIDVALFSMAKNVNDEIKKLLNQFETNANHLIICAA